jgi:dihydrofolate synthase/folylpolyglutamate synthase
VLSVSAGKDLAAICRSLVPFADRLTITRAEPVRSLEPEEVVAAVRSIASELTPRVVPDPQIAVREARERLGPQDLLCAAGSVYLAGIARRVLMDASR